VTSKGKSKIEKKGSRRGKNACKKIAASGTSNVTGRLNR
jgi:hypothetical protein